MSVPYSNNYSTGAAIELAGRCHVLNIGDSQSTNFLNYLFADAWPRACPTFYDYFIVPGSSSANVLGNSFGFGSAGTPVNGTAGAGPTEVSYLTTLSGTGCTRILHPTQQHRFTAAIGIASSMGNGIQLNKMVTSGYNGAPAPSNSSANRMAPWPLFKDNTGRPWFHTSGARNVSEGTTHMKAKLLYWRNALTIDKVGCTCLRQGYSAAAVSATTLQLTGLAGAEGPAAAAWSNVVADAGAWDATGGVGGVANDHEVSFRLSGTTATYDESGTNIIPLGVIFARCTSGGVMFGGRGYGSGYELLGRSGSGVTDWLGYCTQADWQAHFTNSILVPDARTKIRIMLGHNCPEQSSNLTTAAFKTNYKTLIQRIKAAYAAAFPSGVLTIELVVPWVSIQSSAMSNATLAADINTKIKEIAAEESCSWFSFYDAFDGVAPFHALHPWCPMDGYVLANTMRQAMDRATEFRYSTLGPLPMRQRSRGGALASGVLTGMVAAPTDP